jgi:hypothetical protein
VSPVKYELGFCIPEDILQISSTVHLTVLCIETYIDVKVMGIWRGVRGREEKGRI